MTVPFERVCLNSTNDPPTERFNKLVWKLIWARSIPLMSIGDEYGIQIWYQFSWLFHTMIQCTVSYLFCDKGAVISSSE